MDVPPAYNEARRPKGHPKVTNVARRRGARLLRVSNRRAAILYFSR
jgi:hypothetical protein